MAGGEQAMAVNRLLASAACWALLAASWAKAEPEPARQRERLDRGVVAIRQPSGQVYVGWRLLADDPQSVAFNVYRASADAPPRRLNAEPIVATTDFVDAAAPAEAPLDYFVRPVVAERELADSPRVTLPAGSSSRPYLSIPLQTPPGCTPNDAAAADLDGDGRYEIVLKQQQRPRDNSQAGETGQTKLEAYTLAGQMLWRIDLGRNIREGAHYTPFVAFDLDGDGRAEVACKTADGTVDGRGRALGNPAADHRNAQGRVLGGPEFLTIFDGRSGAALATVDYLPPRGEVRDWGDDYGNRVDRFLACAAYLDGRRPSLVMCRGYYTRCVLAAWDWRDGQLTRRWTFDSDQGPDANRSYRGQGNHNLAVGDVDGDGRDEIVYGSATIDDDGRGLYSTGLGHGDALHLGDLDPRRPGLEVFAIHERPRHQHGVSFRDAASGRVLWSQPSPDVARGVALDVDPRHPGSECWGAGGGLRGLYDCRGQRISARQPRPCNMGVWWDADPQRELLDGVSIDKWDWQAERTVRLVSATDFDCAANNGSKANPCLAADLLGDWREEVVWRTRDNRELRIFVSTIPARGRRVTLMHDPIYRLGVAWQNVGYNQPPHTGFFLGEGL